MQDRGLRALFSGDTPLVGLVLAMLPVLVVPWLMNKATASTSKQE